MVAETIKHNPMRVIKLGLNELIKTIIDNLNNNYAIQSGQKVTNRFQNGFKMNRERKERSTPEYR